MGARPRMFLFQSSMWPVGLNVDVVTTVGGGTGTGLDTFFTLTTTATTGTYPFTIGMGFAEGEATTVTTDLTNAQVKVKRLWNDGTVKHAIISGRAFLTQNVARTIALSQGIQTEGTALTSSDIQAAAPSATVQCGAFGTVDLSTLLASPVRTWISGSEMVECHYRSDVGGGTLLSVWFHVRLYADGRKWIRAIVENGYLDDGAGAVAANADRSYVPTITIGGVVVYNNSGAALSHYKNTRYSAEGWGIGSDPQITPAHDVAYLRDSKLAPNYFWRNPSETTLNSLTQTYTQMSNGPLQSGMSAPGDYPGIGILPQWNACYLVTGDPRPYRATLVGSSCLNSYGIVWRDATTKLPLKPSSFPNWAPDGPGQNGSASVTMGPLEWEMNHLPGEAYIAYLLTGDYWHYETLLFNAVTCWLCCGSTTSGVTSRGDGTSRVIAAQVRGTAWGFRSVAMLASIFPTGDDVASEYQTLVENNINYWKAIADTNPNGLGYVYEYNSSNTICVGAGDLYTGTGHTQPWMHNFMIMGFGFTYFLKPVSDMTNFTSLMDFLYKGIVGLLGDSSGYCYTYASAYTIKAAPRDQDLDVSNFYPDWATVFTQTYGASSCGTTMLDVGNNEEGNSVPPVPPSSGDPSIPSVNRWDEILPAIALAYDHGATGAVASWNRIVSSTNWATFRDRTDGLDQQPQWGFFPRGAVDSSAPAWIVAAAPTVLSWTRITGSAMSNLTVTNNPGSHPVANILNAWNGYAYDRVNNVGWATASGGHDDWTGNQTLKFNINVASPVWEEAVVSTTGFTTPSNTTRYSDGSVPSAHTYDCSKFIHSTSVAMRFPGCAYSTVGFQKDTTEGFDTLTLTWAGVGTYPDLPTPAPAAPAVCKHYTTENVYFARNNNNFYRWNKLANTYTDLGPTIPQSFSDSATAHDHTREKIFLYGGAEYASSHLYDIAGNTFSSFPITGAMPLPIDTSGNAAVSGSSYVNKGYGLGYDPNLDKYLVRFGDAGGAVYAIDPVTGVSTSLATTGGGSIAATAIVAGTSQNVYGKWNYVSDLGGYSGWLYTPQHSSDSWFFCTGTP